MRDFRSGNSDRALVWLEQTGRTIPVTYMTVRHEAETHLGTLEFVQDVETAKAHFPGQK